MSDISEQFWRASAANDVKQVTQLLDNGADINFVRDPSFPSTALHSAVHGRRSRIAALLIEKGADLNIVDYSGLTPLMIACSLGKKAGSKLALMLVEAGADVTYERPGDGMTAIKFALWGNCDEAVYEALLERGAKAPEEGFKVVRLK